MPALRFWQACVVLWLIAWRPLLLLAIPIGLLILAIMSVSCAPLSTIGTYTRDPQVCSRVNAGAARIEVVLQDDRHHVQWIGNADPGGHVCGSWSLPGDRGRWGYVSRGVRDGMDTTWGLWFQAWALR